ncbi:LPXTG cell wall anchor domain-containing protein [Streptomyces sp. SID5473]|nr:LPXTG cell wall anchor domain-containing protein [Streptomyces sp. SID5473]
MDAAPATDVHHDSGSALPVIATVGLVVVLGGAAVVTVRRRRRTD